MELQGGAGIDGNCAGGIAQGVDREKSSMPPRMLMSRRPVSPALMKAMRFVETLVRSFPLPTRKAPTPPLGLLAGAGSRMSQRNPPPKVVGPVSVTKRVAEVLSAGPLLTIAPLPPTPLPEALIGSAPRA